MAERIVYRELLSLCSNEQVVITCNENGKRNAGRLQKITIYKCRRELNRVITTQAIVLGQLDRAINNRTIHRKDQEVLITILQEAAQGAVSLLAADTARGLDAWLPEQQPLPPR